MALADDIRTLKHQTLAALDASHDYYADTKRVWRLLQEYVDGGKEFTSRNPVTETTVDQQQLLQRSQRYVTEYLTSSTFQQFVSLFEHFLFELLRDWLVAFPESLSKKKVDFGAVLDAADITAVKSAVVDRELNDLKYRSLPDWFEYLDNLVKLDCPTADDIEVLAEIKASRDIVVHNNGIANATYMRKAGSRKRASAGEPLIISEPYHRESWETIRKVVVDVSNAALAKA